jgi:hypothetical protein
MRIGRRVMVLVSGGVIGALVTVGAVSALAVGTGSATNVTYFACLNGGTLSQVGTTRPTCTSPAALISWNSTGPQGAQGARGPAGTNGISGLSVRTGAAAPTGTCKTGDSYVELTATPGEVFKCQSAAWVNSGQSIRGPKGAAGTDGTDGTNGSSVLTSSGAPSGTCTTGDSDIDITSGEVYNCVGSAWQDSGDSIQGPQGGQGPQGPQGPAGISTGVTFGRVATVPIDSGTSTSVTVITAPAVPTTGIYYLTASLTIQVASTDIVACAAGPNQVESQTAQMNATPTNSVTSPLAVNGALSLTAGQAPHIDCIDEYSDSNTAFLEGTINATLISNSTSGAGGAAHPERFPLKIVRTAK